MDENQVNQAIDVAQLLTFVGAAVLAGFLCSLVVWLILWTVGRRNVVVAAIAKRTRKAIFFAFTTLAVYGILLSSQDVVKTVVPGAAQWADTIKHVTLILVILNFTWLLVVAVRALGDLAEEKYRLVENQSSRAKTQAQILRQLGQAIIVVLGLAAVVLTFPAARLAMGSVLASAGVISVIVGLAAQSSLANIFAGMQIVFTDAVRVGDVVVIDSPGGTHAGQQATIEEITLTYVVVRVWDERRLIVPSTTFTQNSFENWTRPTPELLGKAEIFVDWTIPVAAVRKEFMRILKNSELWNGKVANLQVIRTTETAVVLRVVMSADSAGYSWDLKCLVLEELTAWIARHMEYALPRSRYSSQGDRDIRNGQVTDGLSDRNEVSAENIRQKLMISSGNTPQLASEQTSLVNDENPDTVFEGFFSGTEEAETRGRIYSGPTAELAATEKAVESSVPVSSDDKKEN